MSEKPEPDLLAEAERIDREELEGDGDWAFARPGPPRDPSMIYSLRLPASALEHVRRLAESRGVQPTVLLRTWILERIGSERAPSTRVSEAAPPYRSRRRTSAVDVDRRLDDLAREFERCVDAYDADPEFRSSAQLEWHQKTIKMRRDLRTPRRAVASDDFVASLHTTLRKWRIGSRASKLVDLETFAESLRSVGPELDRLAKLRLDDEDLPLHETIEALWRLIQVIHVVDNKSKVVAGTKTLHHLLPALVPPMDVTWTGRFFRWYPAYYLTRQEKIFEQGMKGFASLAVRCDPARLVGEGWRTSGSKILDNALIGYCRIHEIPPLM